MAHLLTQAESRDLSAFHACALRHFRRFRVRAGPVASNIAPAGAGQTACGTERVTSPAPLPGALRGVPA